MLKSVSGRALHFLVPGWNGVSGMPVSVNIELTSYCNLNCPECATGAGLLSRPAGFIDVSLFTKITGELGPYLYNMNLYFQGEPMLHPRFYSLLDLSKDIPSTLSTNGHFLVDDPERLARSGIRRLIISVDGADQATYSEYRWGGNLEKVIKGLELLRDARRRTDSKMKVEIQMLVNLYNEHQIPEIRSLAKRMDASLSLKSMQILDRDRIKKWQPSGRRFNRYIYINNEWLIKSSLPDRCSRQWFNPVITWDGKVLPCCFDKNADHIMGDLEKETFRDIWHGQRYREFRRKIATDRRNIEICRNCTSGLRGVTY